jgi:hypothetical protein
VTLPGQTFTLPENGLGLSAAVVSKPLILGCSSSGTTNARTEVSQPQAVVDAFGEGPMPEAACRVLQIAGGPVDVIRANGSVAGVAGAVTKVAAGSSTGTITVAGAPYDAYQPMVIITGSGTLGAGTFIYSLDGQDASDVDAHNTWSETLTIPAGGTYAIPRTNLTLTFVPGAGPVFFELGDQHWFECTAPHYNSTDLAAAMTAVLASPGDFAWILFTGRDTSAANGATAFATIDTHLTALENQYRYVRGIMDSGDDTVANVQTAYAAVSDKRITVCYGLVDLPSAKPFAGWGVPGQLVTVALAQRVGLTLLSEDPGRFASGSITGAVNPSHDEFLTGGLDNHKITTVRTYVKAQGLYFTNGWLKSAAGSDYRYWQHGRVMDATCNEVYLQQLKMIAAEPRTNPDGTIFENDARSFEQMVTDGLTAILTAPRNRSGKRGHVSEFSYAIDRSIDLLTTQSIESNVAVRPLGYPKFINTTLGFAKEV